jgi:Domain of unknown function (DUF4833)
MKFVTFLCLSALFGFTGSNVNVAEFPVPPHSKKSLFYIHRSPNPNTVIYDINLTEKNVIDSKNPVKVYWIRYGEKGQLRDLNYVERTFAYGVKLTEENQNEVHFVASKDRKFTVAQDEKGQAYALMNIGGKQSKVTKIFVQVAEEGWWPKIAYVEFFGTDAATNTATYEKMLIK